ncbi:DUF2207 domain-containing protein [Metabacillus fastidiosus]|uniref:DUF2207 domain-containing protein n=1 Tax=Metabacillus fastidiosus TaxID=1458 RepID=UPI003D2C8C81
MNWKQKVFSIFFIINIAGLFLFPNVSLAVDFSIAEVKTDAYLQKNGQVKVKESYTYSFDGDFNGITREIIPKEGTSISDLRATEKEKQLKVEKEDNLYKIHRKGKDELITIDITYTIENGVDVYSDVAEFYWPFFDERNESSYEKMNIIVHPPKQTDDVIAFGYDEAFDTEQIQSNSSVIFQLGEVSSGKNGDIRVAYDAALFPAAPISANKDMKSEIMAAKQELYDNAAAKAKRQKTLSTVAIFLLPIFTAIIVLLLIGTSMRERVRKLDVQRKGEQSFFIPSESLSIPATIYFLKGHVSSEATAAALLDLIRKGYVSKTKDNRFKRADNTSGMLEHEQILTSFLFDEAGSGEEFRFKDLKSYTTKRKNHEKYRSNMMKWQCAVANELKEKDLYEKNGKLRWTMVIASMILVPFLFLFPANGLFGSFFFTIILLAAYLIFSIFYKPKTWNGLTITNEWSLMENRISELSMREWETLTDDEQMRVYIYGLGTNNKNIIKKNEQLIHTFKHPVNIQYNNTDHSAVNLNTIVFLGPTVSSGFYSAHQTTESTSSSSSSSSSNSGGVGGGGGGSGAF